VPVALIAVYVGFLLIGVIVALRKGKWGGTMEAPGRSFSDPS
jgi:hypothetical protein